MSHDPGRWLDVDVCWPPGTDTVIDLAAVPDGPSPENDRLAESLARSRPNAVQQEPLMSAFATAGGKHGRHVDIKPHEQTGGRFLTGRELTVGVETS